MNINLNTILQAVNQFRNETNQRLDRQDDRIEQLLSIAASTNQKFDELKGEQQGMKQELTGMKQDIQEMKQELTEMKQDIQEIKQEQHVIKQDIDQVKVVQLDSFEEITSQLSMIQAQQTDIGYAHTRITNNERDIVKIRKAILG